MQSYLEETRKRLREYARRLVNGQIEAEETWEGMSVNLPEKIGYKRIKKRFRQYGAQYYRFVPSPVFDNKTQFKSWDPVNDEWIVHRIPGTKGNTNASAIFEDLKTKIWVFEGNPKEWFRNIRYNSNYWNNRTALNPLA
jgi:hypothetical protein